MTKKDFYPKLKYYHILIIGCLLSPLLILNSNLVNKKRSKEKLNKEKSKLFDTIISKRYLQEEYKKVRSGIDKICERGSEGLNVYYKNPDLSKLEIKNETLKCEDKDKKYMIALRNLVQYFLGGDNNIMIRKVI